MITITSQPAPTGDLVSPYAPIVYELEATTAYANPPIIKAKLAINAQSFGVILPQPHYFESGGVYKFRFDISELLRQYLSNTDTFNLGGNTNIMPAPDEANAGFAKQCVFEVNFDEWEASGTNGIYELSVNSITSNQLIGLNIAVNAGLLEDDLPSYGFIYPFKFLTNAPERQGTTTDSKNYLSFYDTGNTRRGVEVKTYDSDGVLQNTAYIDIGQPLNSVNRVRRIAVGGADIALITSLTGISHYSITVVDDITAPSPIPLSETRLYFLSDRACKKYNLHFLNIFGADDVIGFNDYIQSVDTEKETYTANTAGYPVANGRGLTALNSRGTQTIVLQRIFPNRIMPWMYEAFNTVEARLQVFGQNSYIAVVIDDVSDEEIKNTNLPAREVEITCILANTDYSHQN